jgi:hypothetical protein
MLNLKIKSSMPNWCWNNIEFTGEQKNIENLSKLIDKTIEMQNKTGSGQLLFGLDGSIDGYMFDICNEDSDEGWIMFSFQSRWAPIPNDMARIAELFNLQFTYSYEESGMDIYGKYTFEIIGDENVLYDQSPTQEQIDECRFKEEDDEDDEKSGFDQDKLENFIENAPMESIPVTRINDTAA